MSIMRAISDGEFDALITRAMGELPQQYIKNLNNVAITYADDPSPEQLRNNHVDAHHVLLGLYEGIPQTTRFSSSYSGVLPDKITLFKNPICQVVYNDASLYEQIKRTLWHEIAHHYGLNHDRIHAIEKHS